MAKLKENSQTGLVWSGIIAIDENNHHLWEAKHTGPTGRAFMPLLKNNYIPQSSVVVRRDCFDRVGRFVEDRQLAGSEDWEMWLRIASHYEVQYITNDRIFYRLHGGSSTMTQPENAERSIRKALDIIVNREEFQSLLPNNMNPVWASHEQKIAIGYYLDGQMKIARRFFYRALQYQTSLILHPRLWYQIGRTFLGNKLTQWIHQRKPRMI